MPSRKATLPSGERLHLLDVPFEARYEASKAGAEWRPILKCHVWQGRVLPAALRPFRSQPYSWERHQEDKLNGAALPTPVLENEADRYIAKKHQVVAVRAIIAAREAGYPGFLLADDVGVGKSISSFDAVRQMPDIETVLIVCPKSVIAHWRQTILHMGDNGKRIVVINYDRFAKLFAAPKPASRKKLKRRRNSTLLFWMNRTGCETPLHTDPGLRPGLLRQPPSLSGSLQPPGRTPSSCPTWHLF